MLHSNYRVKPMDACWLKENVNCQFTCPVHTNAGGYVGLIAAGQFEEAFRVAAEPNPLVSICGRICAHPCETACRRRKIDEPVAIRALKRFAVENGQKQLTYQPKISRKQKVAVIGSGPAGLSCAHDLALFGYQVTIFEAQEVAGGMLHLGIPEYRLPRQIISDEVEKILQMGVELQTGRACGRDFSLSDLKKQGYEAIFLGVGACRSRELKIPGHDLDGVLKGVDFLLNVNLGYEVNLGQKVIVIGGGNVAIDVARSAARLGESGQTDMITAVDAARSALRMGAKEVHLVCLESREEMPAAEDEIEEALEEGIIFHCSRGPKAVRGKDGKATGLLTEDVSSVFDAQGRFNPSFVVNSERLLDADTVIMAIGQQSDFSFLQPEDKVELTSRGTVTVDNDTLATSAPGIFAGGDAAFGPRIAINAIADGRNAARSIHRLLMQEEIKEEESSTFQIAADMPPRATDDDYLEIKRQHIPLRQVDKRVGVTEVELGFDREAAQKEARRCLQCFFNPAVDSEECLLCGGCVDICPYNCLKLVSISRIKADPHLQGELADRLQFGRDQIVELFATVGDYSIMLKDEELCVRCGLCADRCPSGAMNLVKYVWQERSFAD